MFLNNCPISIENDLFIPILEVKDEWKIIVLPRTGESQKILETNKELMKE